MSSDPKIQQLIEVCPNLTRERAQAVLDNASGVLEDAVVLALRG